MIDVARLNLRMCDYAIARLNAMGSDAGGLYNYYEHLARKDSMLRPEEIAIAEHIDRTVPKSTPILELCAGAAQLSHLLSLMGYRTTAVEIDVPRYDFAVALGAHVGSKCAVVRQSWQSLKLSKWKLLVTLNAVTSHIVPADTERLRSHAVAGGELVIRPRQFGSGIAVEIPGLNATQVFEDVYHYAA